MDSYLPYKGIGTHHSANHEHQARGVKPPLDVIEALFRLGRVLYSLEMRRTDDCNNNLLKTPLWSIQSNDGSTPFLVACSTGASTPIISRYLDEIDCYIEKQWIPCGNPTLNPNIAPHESNHHARMLVLQPDNQGNNPLMGWMAFHSGWIEQELKWMKDPSRSTGSINGSSNGHQSYYNSHHLPRHDREESTCSLSEYKSLACRMLLYATMHIHPHKNNNSPALTPVLMHRCAAIAPFCPVSLLEWMMSPMSLQASDNTRQGSDDKDSWISIEMCAATTDSKGRLPFHCALEATTFSPFLVGERACDEEDDAVVDAEAGTDKNYHLEACTDINSSPTDANNRTMIQPAAAITAMTTT